MKRGWAAGLLTTLVVALASVVGSPLSSFAQPVFSAELVTLSSSASPPPPAHSVALGRLSASALVHIDVALKVPNPEVLSSFVASLSNRKSPNFHHFLQAGQFGQIFGPPLSELSKVEAVLRSDGLQPGRPSPSRLLIPVSAPAAAIDRAFHVSLVRYRLPTGRVAFTSLSAPSISASVSADVDGVIGLSELVEPHDMLASSTTPLEVAPHASSLVHPRTAGPAPCQQAAQSASGSYTADQLAAYYGMTPLYSLGDFGQNIHIAIAEFEPNFPSDISTYQACYGTNATVNYIAVDGGVSAGPGTDSEAAMDIEDVIGLAPQATVDVYQAPTPSNADVLDLYSEIVSPPPGVQLAAVVSTSWGECELDQDASDSSYRSSEWAIFQQAAAQGQTVVAAAGDAGAADCYGDPKSPNQNVRAVDDPASQPDVVGVGGTTISAGSETVWNDSAGSSGGGVSSSWCMPAYQDQSMIQGLISPNSQLAGAVVGCPAGSYLRQVPDVSADADPTTGYVIYWNGSWTGVHGGTSAAAPLWAAIAALIDSSPYCAEDGSGHPGVLPAGLYSIASLGSPYYGLAFSDVTNGNNDNSLANVTGYNATPGYDLASGLGSPIVAYSDNYRPGLAAQMCLEYRTNSDLTQITRISPSAGPSGQPIQVTITGSGFLTIPGADRLQVGSSTIAATCSSATSCTATLPAAQAGTVDLVMIVEDSTISPVVSTDRFTYTDSPTVTKLTPALGPDKGGTRVTIWGVSFVGVVSVRFGNKPATDVHVISSSELSVAVPAGEGATYVIVSTDVGSSRASSTSKYTFVAAPTVAKVSPELGPKKGGTKVTIWGSNFVGSVSVRFGNKLVSDVHVISSSELSLPAPSGSGTPYVSVSTLAGSSRNSPVSKYRFVTTPTLDTLSPPFGSKSGGNKVIIRGANFFGTVSVRFGHKEASGVRVRSSSEIIAVAPRGSGTVYVTVSTVGGTTRQVPTGRYRY